MSLALAKAADLLLLGRPMIEPVKANRSETLRALALTLDLGHAFDRYLNFIGPDDSLTESIVLLDVLKGAPLSEADLRWRLNAHQVRVLTELLNEATRPGPPPETIAVMMNMLMKRRLHLGLTQTQMADLMKITPLALSNMENLGIEPTLPQMLQYMQVLETKFNELRKRPSS